MGKITINCSFDVGVDSVYAGCNSNNIKTTEKGSEKKQKDEKKYEDGCENGWMED